MPDHQDDGRKRQAEDVPAVETDQGGGPGLRSANQAGIKRRANERNGFDQVGPGNQRPVDALIPAQDVTGEIQQNRQHEQPHPKQVIETARRQISAGEDHAQQMHSRDDHQELRRPEMQIAHQSPERDEEGQGLDRKGCLARGWDVIEDLQDAGHRQHQHQDTLPGLRPPGYSGSGPGWPGCWVDGGGEKRMDASDELYSDWSYPVGRRRGWKSLCSFTELSSNPDPPDMEASEPKQAGTVKNGKMG